MTHKTIKDFLPGAEVIVSLEPEELAGHLLDFLVYESGSNVSNNISPQLNRKNLTQPAALHDYSSDYQVGIAFAITEAWMWLEHEGLIAPRPGKSCDWIFVTRRGRTLENSAGLETYRKANLLPKGLLHPTIATKVYPAFLRGEYDTAVFQAFREVEVAVRREGGFDANDLGVKLMRQAFAPDKPPNKPGPLTDTSAHIDEQEALAHLFSGAIGYLKNPTSHRNVTIIAEEAVELIMFASYLLRIVDARSPTT